jgi:hypothetical protein
LRQSNIPRLRATPFSLVRSNTVVLPRHAAVRRRASKGKAYVAGYRNFPGREFMNTFGLTTNEIIAIVVAAIIVLAAIVLIVRAIHLRRTKRLRAQFGPEYDRTVAELGARSKAEARLAARSERVHKLNIRSLTAGERDRFAIEWNRVQTHFVDAPAGAVAEADQLLGDVMATCGYPVGDFEQRAADISVDHPIVTQNYRAAHSIALRHASGQATTEELRRAMIHYRALVEELLGSTDVPANRIGVQDTVEPIDANIHRRAS